MQYKYINIKAPVIQRRYFNNKQAGKTSPLGFELFGFSFEGIDQVLYKNTASIFGSEQ